VVRLRDDRVIDDIVLRGLEAQPDAEELRCPHRPTRTEVRSSNRRPRLERVRMCLLRSPSTPDATTRGDGAVKPGLFAMARAVDADEIRALLVSPDVVVGSVRR